MDAVLPLRASDHARFALLLHSLRRNVAGLERLWVVMPAEDLRSLRVPPGPGPQIELCSELTWVPELTRFTRVGGWYRQQIVKLEASRWVGSDFYLTLDADVLATRRVDLNALTASGKSPCHVDHADLHPKWYAAAQDLVGKPLPRQGISHNVTPAILQRDAVRGLLQHLERRWLERDFCSGLRGLKQRLARAYARMDPAAEGGGARSLLCASRPWSEYSLYYSFLEANGDFERTHFEATPALYEIERSVWFERDFERWQPEGLFGGEGPPYFVVVQSNARIPIAQLQARIAPHLGL
jgi:hypothetical protein